MTERIKLLDDLGAELARVTAAAERSSRKPHFRAGARARTLPIALAMTAALGGTAYAVPATRTALDGITGPLAAWVSGDDDSAPGRALTPGDDAPGWLSQTGSDGVRLIAEAEGVGLYVEKVDLGRGPMLGFSLGRGRGITDSLEGWRERMDRHTVFVLGDSIFGGERGVLDDRGRIPLFGVTTRDVKRVELRYVEGPPLVSENGDGGFVLLVDAWRPMREIVAYDAAGHEVGRADVSKYDLRYQCEKEPGCPTAG
jgi:hypothetical protein